MIESVLRWVFEYEGKQIHVVLHPETPLGVIQNMAYEILKYCAKVESELNSKNEETPSDDKKED